MLHYMHGVDIIANDKILEIRSMNKIESRDIVFPLFYVACLKIGKAH